MRSVLAAFVDEFFDTEAAKVGAFAQLKDALDGFGDREARGLLGA